MSQAPFPNEGIASENFWQSLVLDQMKKQREYRMMDHEALLSLSDEELLEAVDIRIQGILERPCEEDTAPLALQQCVAFAVNAFCKEMNNGGLCQFLVNCGERDAPWLSAFLEMLGAEDYQCLYDRFLEENKIDPKNLSDFRILDTADYLAIYQKYPFQTFDDAYNAMSSKSPLEVPLAAFIRENIELF